MILVDSSVWVDHLRSGDARLVACLEQNRALTHPFVIGEIACGNLRRRSEVLRLLREFPVLPVASDDEVLFFIDQHRFMGRGIGYVDAHLLAATMLNPPVRLWTRDRALASAARVLGLLHTEQ